MLTSDKVVKSQLVPERAGRAPLDIVEKEHIVLSPQCGMESPITAPGLMTPGMFFITIDEQGGLHHVPQCFFYPIPPSFL